MTIKPKIEEVASLVAMAMIAFQIYWHLWWINVLGVGVANPLLPIGMITIVALIYIWRDGRWPDLRTPLPEMWICLGFYLLFASVSTLINETEPRQAIHWLVYAWSPPAVFLSVHGLRNLKRDAQLSLSLKFLFFVIIILSICVLPANGISTHTGLGRFLIPGLNATHYAPMLLPLIFLGLHWVRQSKWSIKWLFVAGTGFLSLCLFATATKAALIPLIIGLTYLAWVRWIRRRYSALIGFAVLALFMFNPQSVQRVVSLVVLIEPVRQILSIEPIRLMLARVAEMPPWEKEIERRFWLDNDHFYIAYNSLEFAIQRPILGIGMGHMVDSQNTNLAVRGGKSHNNYASIAGGFGFPALLFYISFIFTLGLYVRRSIVQMEVGSEFWSLGHIWMATLISYAAYLNGAPAEFHFLWLWFALIAIWLRNRQEEIMAGKNHFDALRTEQAMDCIEQPVR